MTPVNARNQGLANCVATTDLRPTPREWRAAEQRMARLRVRIGFPARGVPRQAVRCAALVVLEGAWISVRIVLLLDN